MANRLCDLRLILSPSYDKLGKRKEPSEAERTNSHNPGPEGPQQKPHQKKNSGKSSHAQGHECKPVRTPCEKKPQTEPKNGSEMWIYKSDTPKDPNRSHPRSAHICASAEDQPAPDHCLACLLLLCLPLGMTFVIKQGCIF